MNQTLMLEKLFEVRDAIHYMHLNTTSFAVHKALNSFYDSWLDLADSFVEKYQGKYGRITGQLIIEVSDKTKPVEYMKNLSTVLDTEITSLVGKNDSDLLNIIADMKGLVNETLYLLTLN